VWRKAGLNSPTKGTDFDSKLCLGLKPPDNMNHQLEIMTSEMIQTKYFSPDAL